MGWFNLLCMTHIRLLSMFLCIFYLCFSFVRRPAGWRRSYPASNQSMAGPSPRWWNQQRFAEQRSERHRSDEGLDRKWQDNPSVQPFRHSLHEGRKQSGFWIRAATASRNHIARPSEEPAVKRFGLNNSMSWPARPDIMRFARISPTTLQNLNPCPLKPAATFTCGNCGCSPMTKFRSGVSV